MSKAFLMFALLPLAFALSADEPEEREVPMKRIEKKDIPLDELAHGFFVMRSAPDVLAGIISAEGLERLKPELAAHKRDIHDEARGEKLIRWFEWDEHIWR